MIQPVCPVSWESEQAYGDLSRFPDGIAIGSGVAHSIGATVGDRVKLTSPNGVKTAFGTSPRVKAYEVVHVFSAGRYDIDRTRVYMPFAEAQVFFNREGGADEIEVMVEHPEDLDPILLPILNAAGEHSRIWTWQDASGGFLRALEIEDNVMFIILSILVLIATMNIVSGLIMLVKNKGSDIGILRTIGLSEGSVLRIFFICGAFTGIIGTGMGVILGCLFAIFIDPIFSFPEPCHGWRCLGSVDSRYLCIASRIALVGRTQDCGVFTWPVLSCYLVSGPPCGAAEPDRGTAL